MLVSARLSQGILLGKAAAIGLEGLQPHILEALTDEAITTSKIEGAESGEKLDVAQRSQLRNTSFEGKLKTGSRQPGS